MIKEAMKYVTELKEQAMEPKIVEINGRTYCDKELRRYDVNEKSANSVNTYSIGGLYQGLY